MTSLLEAATDGNLAQLEVGLSAGGDLETRDSEGDTALTIASARGYLNVVRFLLEKGSQINAKCDAGNSALHSAALKDHLAIVEILLEKGADKDAQNKKGNTPLRIAASNGSSDVLRALIKNGANPNIPGNDGSTPLMAVANRGALPEICALLDAGADPNATNDDGQSALMFAVNKGTLASVTTLFDAGAKVGNSGTSLIAASMASRDFESMAFKIIEVGGTPSDLFQGATALMMAIASKNLAVVEALLAAGADPNQVCLVNSQDMSPLFASVMSGDVQCTRSLLRYGADPNQGIAELVTPLAAAMVGDHREVQQLLLAAGALFTKASVMLPSLNDEGESQISNDLATELRWQVVEATSMVLGVGDQFERPALVSFATKWLEKNVREVAHIVISNHVGVQRRRDEEARVKNRCVHEIAKLLICGTDLYEDDDGVVAMAEFILSGIRYRQLVELGRQSVTTPTNILGDGRGYEEACRNELIAHGYSANKTPTTGDQGADLLADKSGITYAIQCKNYAGSVGNSAVQEAISAKQYYGTDNAVVVSEGRFTTSARELAARAKVVLCKKDSIRNIDVVCSTIA